MKRTLALFAVAVLVTTTQAATETWQATAVDNYWTNVANWSVVVPGSGDIVNFTTSGNGYTNINLSSTNTITVNKLQFGVNSPAYTIGTGGPGSQDLAFDPNGNLNMWAGVSADQKIDADLHIGSTNSQTYYMNNWSTNATLFLNNVYRTGGDYNDYFKIQRDGTTEIAGTLNNSSGTGDLDVVVEGGNLVLSGGNNWDGDLRIRDDGSVIVTTSGVLTTQGALDLRYGTATINSDQTIGQLNFGENNTGGDVVLNIASNAAVRLTTTARYYDDNNLTNTAVVTGGTFDLGADHRTINVDDNALVTGAELTIESDIVNTNGATTYNLNKSGAGTLRLNAANYDYKKLQIWKGHVQVNSFDALGGVTATWVGNGNDGDETLEFLSDTDTTKGHNINIGGPNASDATEADGAIILNNGAGKVTFNWDWINTTSGNPATNRTITLGGTNTLENRYGGLRDHNGSAAINLVKKDSGKWMADLTSTYTGTTTIEGGTLQINRRTGLYNGTTASWTTGNIAVQSNATLTAKVGGANGFTSADLDILLALGGATGGFEDGAIAGIHTGSGNFTYSSVIADPNAGANSLALLKTGGNKLTLDQANTYSGGTTLEKGVLWFENENALGTGGILIKDEGTDPVLEFGADGLNLTNDITVSDTGGLKQIRAGLTVGNNAMELSGDMVVNESTLGDFAFRVNNPGAAVNVLTMSGPISGSGSIGKSGWGKLILSGNNTYSGGTKIIDGMIQLGANGDSGNILGDVEFQGGSGGDELRFARSNDFTFASNISGDGKVSTIGNEVDETTGTEEGDAGKFNSELLILTGSNTYTGGTTVNRETRLLAAHANALGSGNVTLNGQDAGLILSNGVTLANNVVAGDENRLHVGIPSGSATLSGDILINNNSVYDMHLRPDSGETLTVDGAIQDNGGDGSWIKSSSGTLILNGDNTYTGNTRIDNGSVTINGDDSAANGNIEIYNGATLGGTGTVGSVVEAFGNSTVTGTLTFTNAVTVYSNLKPGTSPGTLTFNDALTLGSNSTTTIDIASLGSFDKLANDGGDTVTFVDTATIAFDASSYTANNGDSFQILDNWSGYAGTLANLSFTGTNLGGSAYLDTSTLLTDGKVTVVGSAVTPASLYADWATLKGLTGANNGLGDNPDGDALDNLAEYALGGDPTNKNDTGIAPILWLGADGGTNWFYYAHAQRSDSGDRDLTYTVKQDTDLPTATWAGSVDLLGTNVTGGAFDSVTNRVPTDTETEQFLQLQISTSM